MLPRRVAPHARHVTYCNKQLSDHPQICAVRMYATSSIVPWLVAAGEAWNGARGTTKRANTFKFHDFLDHDEEELWPGGGLLRRKGLGL